METEMVTVKHYESPLGEILLAADETGLIGLWFMGQKYFARTLPKTYRTGESPILDSASKWLSPYPVWASGIRAPPTAMGRRHAFAICWKAASSTSPFAQDFQGAGVSRSV